MPSPAYVEKHSFQLTAKAGSVMLFDAMMFHRAGYNSSEGIRRGVNHMFTTGILKQQINIPSSLKGKFADDPYLRMLFDYDATPPATVTEWRQTRIKKMKRV